MSILIKGMEMPTSCGECDLCACYVREDGTEENYRCPITMYPIHNFDERHKRCPLVELPPHGRLIDADALMKKVEHDTPLSTVFEKTMRMYLNNAPTIIEAEEE